MLPIPGGGALVDYPQALRAINERRGLSSKR